MLSAMSNNGFAQLPRFPEYNNEEQNNNNNNNNKKNSNNNNRLSAQSFELVSSNTNFDNDNNSSTEYAQALEKLREMSEILNNITQRLQHENKTVISSAEYDELHNTVLLLYITVISMKSYVSDPSIFYESASAMMNNNNNNNSNHANMSSNNNNNNSQPPPPPPPFITNYDNNYIANTTNMMINYQTHPPTSYHYDNNNTTSNLHPQHHNISYPYPQHQTNMSILNQPIPSNPNPNPIFSSHINNNNLQPATSSYEYISNPSMISGLFTNQNQNYIPPSSQSDVTHPHHHLPIFDHSISPPIHDISRSGGGNMSGDIHLHHHNYMFNNNEQIINNNYYHHNEDDDDDDDEDDGNDECGDRVGGGGDDIISPSPRIVFNHRPTSNHTTQYANIENPLSIHNNNNNNNNNNSNTNGGGGGGGNDEVGGDEVQLLFDDYLQTYINTPKKNIFIVSNHPPSGLSSPTSSSEMHPRAPSATLVKKEKRNSQYNPNFTQYTTTKNTAFSSPKWSSKVSFPTSSSTSSSPSSSSAFESSFTPRKRKFSAKNMSCYICKETATPEWRKGPDGSHSLCNACGLNYAKKIKTERQTLEKQGLSKTSIDVIINDIKFKLSKQIEDERAKKLDKKLSWKKTSPSFSSSPPS